MKKRLLAILFICLLPVLLFAGPPAKAPNNSNVAPDPVWGVMIYGGDAGNLELDLTKISTIRASTITVDAAEVAINTPGIGIAGLVANPEIVGPVTYASIGVTVENLETVAPVTLQTYALTAKEIADWIETSDGVEMSCDWTPAQAWTDLGGGSVTIDMVNCFNNNSGSMLHATTNGGNTTCILYSRDGTNTAFALGFTFAADTTYALTTRYGKAEQMLRPDGQAPAVGLNPGDPYFQVSINGTYGTPATFKITGFPAAANELHIPHDGLGGAILTISTAIDNIVFTKL